MSTYVFLRLDNIFHDNELKSAGPGWCYLGIAKL